MSHKTIRSAIKAWQGKRSDRQAAEELGVAPNTLANWKAGTHTPPATRLPTLAKTIGVPLADMVAMADRQRKAIAMACK
jgi:transcriptional regulator with XRE-family HTH domain